MINQNGFVLRLISHTVRSRVRCVMSDGTESKPALVQVSLASGKVLSSTPRTTGQSSIGNLIGLYRFAWADGRAYAADWNPEPDNAPTVFTMSASS